MKPTDTTTCTPAERLAHIDALIAALSREREVTIQSIVESVSVGDADMVRTQPEAASSDRGQSPGTDAPATRTIRDIVHIVQGDDRWKDAYMGAVGYKGSQIGSDGCVLSVLSALAAHHLKRAVTPIVLNKFLQENGGYAPDSAMVVWGALVTLLKKYGLTASHRQTKDPGDVPGVVREQIARDCPVVLRMRGDRGPHFVLAIGHTEDDIVTHDPGTWRGSGYGTDGQPPCTLKNPTRALVLEGAEVYEVSGTLGGT